MDAFNRMGPAVARDAAAVRAESGFLAGVYRWMSLGLLVTALSAIGVASSPRALEIIFGNTLLRWTVVLAPLGIVFYLSARVMKISVTAARGWFLLFSALMGAGLSSIFLVYQLGSIGTTFLVTAGTFGAMSLVGYFTDRDLSSFGSFLTMGLIGMILASVVNIFWANSTLYWATTYIGVFVFLGLTVYDTNKLKAMSYQLSGQDAALVGRMSILGALALYLDFINLFLLLLRLFGGERRR